jgi:hypothetical protein
MEEHHQTYQEKQWNGSPLLKAGFVMEKRAGDIPFRRQLLFVLSRPTRRSGVRVWHKVERKRYSDGRTALRDGWMLGVAVPELESRERSLRLHGRGVCFACLARIIALSFRAPPSVRGDQLPAAIDRAQS